MLISKKYNLIPVILSAFLFGFLCTKAQAGIPMWSLSPLTATTVGLASNNTATVQYRVTNNSSKSFTLSLRPITGVSQTTAGAGICGNPFTLAGNASCTLSLQIDGGALTNDIHGGPVICYKGIACYQPTSTNILNITRQAVSQMTITNISPNSGPAAGGTGVTITGTGLTDTSSITFDGISATSVNVINSTTVTAVTPAHAAGAVDVEVITPTAWVTQSNGFTYVSTAVGLSSSGGTIGCLDGGTLNLVASSSDNSASIEWGGSGLTTNAQSNLDGDTNTETIVLCLGNNGGTPYAAELCDNYEVDSQGNTPCQAGNACYSDWFLPSLDQLNCLYTNKAVIGGFSASNYLSSTENTGSPSNTCWTQSFADGVQATALKNALLKVRCVRVLSI